MLNKNEKKLIRNMLNRLLYCNASDASNISGFYVFDLYLCSLVDDKKISLKNYYKIKDIFSRGIENYSYQKTIISFKGVNYD